jgi:Domain of unknown function (DUF5606)
MNLEKYLVVSGIPGVHKLVASRNNGFIIDDRQQGRHRFVAMRQNQVTPLGTISIYTDTDEGMIALGDVFQKMLDQVETIPPAAPDANSAVLRAYFTAVLPEHDQDRVHINDIKKCIKWFNFMHANGIFAEIRAADTEAPTTVDVEPPTPAETAEPAPETTETPKPE